MTVLAVDLAARYSAACWMADDYRVLSQFDSWQKTEAEFIDLCVAPWSKDIELRAQELKVDVAFKGFEEHPASRCTVTLTHLPTGKIATAVNRNQLRAMNMALTELRDLVNPVPDVMVIEDLPHGLKYSSLIKAVCRLQGRIVQAMHEIPEGDPKDILFAAPIAWREHYDLKRGTGSTIVVPTAAQFGYHPPDMTQRAKGNGGATLARKVETDYCAAYLIARWAIDMKKTTNTYDVVGTSRPHTTVIRKKDIDGEQNS